MTQTQNQTPSRLLLASDMSARCDRALDRAGWLAKTWQAQLIVVHAVDPAESARNDRFARVLPAWRRPQDWQATAAGRLRQDLSTEGITAVARVAEGVPADAVLEVAREDKADLIITGIARDDPLMRIQLGSTVDRLVREAPAPVLTVRRRASHAYRHVVMATDFSPASQSALVVALRWFGACRVTLFHAYQSPGAGLAGEAPAGDAWRAVVERQCATFLEESGVDADALRRIDRVFERGHPETLLPDFVRAMGVDLVVLGSQGRGILLRVLLGSTAENLLRVLECDTMVVRRP